MRQDNRCLKKLGHLDMSACYQGSDRTVAQMAKWPGDIVLTVTPLVISFYFYPLLDVFLVTDNT